MYKFIVQGEAVENPIGEVTKNIKGYIDKPKMVKPVGEGGQPPIGKKVPGASLPKIGKIQYKEKPAFQYKANEGDHEGWAQLAQQNRKRAYAPGGKISVVR